MIFTDRMKAELDEAAGAEFERLAESHARERWPIGHGSHKLGEKWRLGFVIGAIWARGMFRRDAEKAERERDEVQVELLRQVEKAERERDEAWKRAAEAAKNPRPLTADDITDEMVRRALDATGRKQTVVNSLTGSIMRQALTDALTMPPARPEGAEEIEAVLREEWSFSDEDGGEEAFADLAGRLAQRGFRVVSEDGAR